MTRQLYQNNDSKSAEDLLNETTREFYKLTSSLSLEGAALYGQCAALESWYVKAPMAPPISGPNNGTVKNPSQRVSSPG
jgi:hypothetical protein